MHIHLTGKFFKYPMTVYYKLDWERGHHSEINIFSSIPQLDLNPGLPLFSANPRAEASITYFTEEYKNGIRHVPVCCLLVFLPASEHY